MKWSVFALCELANIKHPSPPSLQPTYIHKLENIHRNEDVIELAYTLTRIYCVCNYINIAHTQYIYIYKLLAYLYLFLCAFEMGIIFFFGL